MGEAEWRMEGEGGQLDAFLEAGKRRRDMVAEVAHMHACHACVHAIHPCSACLHVTRAHTHMHAHTSIRRE